MYAMTDVHEMDPTVTTIEASEVTAPTGSDTRHIVEYEDYNGDRLDVRRSSSSESTTPSSRTDESYFEQYERSQKKAKKP
jgi:hypothetical protein